MVGGDDQQRVAPVVAVRVRVEIVDDVLDRTVEIDLLFDHVPQPVAVVGPVYGAAFDHDRESGGVVVEHVQSTPVIVRRVGTLELRFPTPVVLRDS